jgi:hypothetical protein
MSEQPKLPEGTEPLSCVLGLVLCDTDGQDEVVVSRDTIKQWWQWASAYEKLAAEFQAARRLDQLEIETLQGQLNSWRLVCGEPPILSSMRELKE